MAFHALLDEHYEEDNEDAPISAFAASQGVAYYDHDWQEAFFLPDFPGTVRQAVGEAACEAFNAALGGQAIGAIKLFVMPDCIGIDAPRSARVGEVEIVFLGTFDLAI
ncbi:MAG: hypothetical protein AAF439_14830 [Pseudomonadota bacterium]